MIDEEGSDNIRQFCKKDSRYPPLEDKIFSTCLQSKLLCYRQQYRN